MYCVVVAFDVLQQQQTTSTKIKHRHVAWLHDKRFVCHTWTSHNRLRYILVAGPGFDLGGRGLCQRGGVEKHLGW